MTDLGFTIWFLLLTSILTLSLIIERLISLRKNKVIPPRVSDQLISSIRSDSLSKSVLDNISALSPSGELIVEVVKIYQKNQERNKADLRNIVSESIQNKADLVREKLSFLLVTLGTLAVIAPLLGLLGTVFGMIDIFAAAPTGGDPVLLAKGISAALYNTAFGLLIAIPAMIFHRAFRSRVDSYMLQLESLCNEILDALVDQKSENQDSSPEKTKFG